MPEIKILNIVLLKKKIFEYFFMYFCGLNLGPWTLEPLFEQTWKTTIRHAMLHTKCQASEQSVSETEEFLVFFYVFLWFETEPSSSGEEGF